MAVNKPRINVTTSINVVMYTMAFYGMMPFSLLSYHRHKILKTSVFGSVYSIVNTIHNSYQYHVETIANFRGQDSGRYYTLCYIF